MLDPSSLEALALRVESGSGPALELPAEMTPAIKDALSLMLWHSGSIARAYRECGVAIRTKAEDEQAFVLWKTLRFAITHGDAWREAAQQDLRATRARALAQKEEG